ncbi:MAG: hypothetical protein COU29_02970 [Candidatus Magasanikbacteria bacterium CG10_big_fil_rev_8_21_14_0_10_36_32]|uniref:Sortilin N-terminal domain-containing protein n=1 Tax=Candidatus Magasanikbacteria bacterium CG10_big_fil_rev_8_21_14_0_10_36_32 TaxID=1974646 RepID=A0A2M6W5Z2_9BACT|nr:MAG: hypothetical protein COU29_02970 [Candidatus Magasanikbacteria bacterium CG10_big_fil_rev_8_21_14_0_10_36_32]
MIKKITFLCAISCFLLFTGASCITTTTQSQPVGVYRSENKGDKWEQVAILPTAQGLKSIANIKVYRIFEDPSDSNAFYLGTRGQGLFYTYNNGDSWQSVAAMSGKFIYSMAVDPKDKCNLYASDGLHIYKSVDCSRSWELMFTEERGDQRFVSIGIDAADSKVVYAAQLGGDILVSRDSGISWQVIKRFNFQLQDMAIDYKTPKRIYVASYRNGLYRSDDSGVTWLDMNKGLEPFQDSKVFYRVSLNSAQKDSLYWICKYGILRSDDSGATWTDLKLLTPPGAVAVYGFAVSPNNQQEIYYTGTILGEKNEHVKSTFYKTSDGGITWVTKKLPTTTIPVMIKVNPTTDNVLLMGFAVLD